MHSKRIAMYNRKSFGEGSHGHRSGNKVRELVAFYIVRAVKKFDVANV